MLPRYLTAAAISLMSVGTGSVWCRYCQVRPSGRDCAIVKRPRAVSAPAQADRARSGQYAPLWLDSSGRHDR